MLGDLETSLYGQLVPRVNSMGEGDKSLAKQVTLALGMLMTVLLGSCHHLTKTEGLYKMPGPRLKVVGNCCHSCLWIRLQRQLMGSKQ